MQRKLHTNRSIGFFTISKSDRISARQKNSGKINLLKCCLQWDLNSQQQPPLIWSLMPNQLGDPDMWWMGDLSNELQSHSIDSRNYPSPKSEVVHETKKIYSAHPIQHMSGWSHWLGIRLQMNDGCCWEIKSHWRQLFSKFIFPELFCLTDLLSDLLIVQNPIVKLAARIHRVKANFSVL